MTKFKEVPWFYAGLSILGLLAIAGLLALLTDVIDGHVKQAQVISRAASWQGQPVGVMPQTGAAVFNGDHFLQVNTLTITAP